MLLARGGKVTKRRKHVAGEGFGGRKGKEAGEERGRLVS